MDLLKMEADVLDYCQVMGWYDTDVSFMTAMALLHEEAAEAGSAWRKHGLEDMTEELRGYQHGLPKPEGVGSEFADVLIRALDDGTRFGLALPLHVRTRGGVFGLHEEFLDNINVLHGLIARTSMAWDGGDDFFYKPAGCLADVVRFTMQLAEHYGIDLVCPQNAI